MSAKILVVDDEPDVEILVRQRYRKKIQEGKFQFAFAHNGVEALEQLQVDREIDIALIDIKMPEMDGLTLLAKLSDLDSVVKVVIVSAYNDMKNIRTAMNRGAFDFLTKPIDFEDLDITINKTLEYVQQLKESQRLRQIQEELNVARRIQQSILPRDLPSLSGLDIQVRYIPMTEVGGDFYDFHVISEKKLGIFISDASGHGVPAALIGAMVKIAFSAQQSIAHEPSQVLTSMNRTLYGKWQSQFVTAGYTYLDLECGTLCHADAGHLPALVWKKREQKLHKLKPAGLIMGWLPEINCPSIQFAMEPEDRILLYTDGITESQNSSGAFFGETCFQNVIKAKQDSPASEFADFLLDSLANWSEQKEGFADDVMLIVIDVLECEGAGALSRAPAGGMR